MTESRPPDYPFLPVPFTAVTFDDRFWLPRLDTNRSVTIPYDLEKCEQTGRVDNFRKAAGRMEGPHIGLVFNDSDLYKAIEGAAFSLQVHPDPELESRLDELIAVIADAQEPDGYLYTARTIDPAAVTAEREGTTRWSNLRFNHELYDLGHLYEAAVAHHLATGKDSLLDIARRSADLICAVFGPEKRRDVPGHQEVELGLVKLFRVTGERRYLDLARFFLDERGHYHDREERRLFDVPGYAQDHRPVIEQREAVGHAVRAGYMYAAMADVAALTGDRDYVRALDALWENVVARKLYLTGGIGARHHGEAFGDDYELPNATAYTETCAAIANIYWNQRMFLLHGEGRFLDVLERTLYNGFLSGTSLAGDRFFYPNPLASDGVFEFNRDGGVERNPWFECSCCPTNVVRLFPALPGYVAATRDDTVFVCLYVAGETQLQLPPGGEGQQPNSKAPLPNSEVPLPSNEAQLPNSDGQLSNGRLRLRQEHDYPWDGRLRIALEPERPGRFTLALRIPGWARGRPVPSDLYRYLDDRPGDIELRVNGDAAPLDIEGGFARIEREWRAGDEVELILPMPVRRVVAHERVDEDRGRVAVERGPLVYCAEGIDNGGRALSLELPDENEWRLVRRDDLLGGVTLLHGAGVTLVPYYAWAHRGPGEMAVWLQRRGT